MFGKIESCVSLHHFYFAKQHNIPLYKTNPNIKQIEASKLLGTLNKNKKCVVPKFQVTHALAWCGLAWLYTTGLNTASPLTCNQSGSWLWSVFLLAAFASQLLSSYLCLLIGTVTSYLMPVGLVLLQVSVVICMLRNFYHKSKKLIINNLLLQQDLLTV